MSVVSVGLEWFGMVNRGYVMNGGRGYVIIVGRGHVIQNRQSVSESVTKVELLGQLKIDHISSCNKFYLS